MVRGARDESQNWLGLAVASNVTGYEASLSLFPTPSCCRRLPRLPSFNQDKIQSSTSQFYHFKAETEGAILDKMLSGSTRRSAQSQLQIHQNLHLRRSGQAGGNRGNDLTKVCVCYTCFVCEPTGTETHIIKKSIHLSLTLPLVSFYLFCKLYSIYIIPFAEMQSNFFFLIFSLSLYIFFL